MNNYPGQICQDEDINYEFINLHHEIVDKIVKFCKRNNIEIDEVSFSADGIMNSVPYDQWQAGTDSSFAMWKDNKDEPFLWSI